MTILDLFLVPLYIFAIYHYALKFRNKYYPENHPLHKYLIPGLLVKISGALMMCFIYIYYFKAGDTLGFYYYSKVITSALFKDTDSWWRLITHNVDFDNSVDGSYYAQIGEQGYLITNYIMSILAAIIGLFCFNSFLCISIIIATITYTGFWALFKTFSKLYPQIILHCAIATLFIPSVALWGSGLFKDSICMFALGWLTYNVFYPEKYLLKNFLGIAVSAVILFVIKVYILAVFLPAFLIFMTLKVVKTFNSRLKKSIFIMSITLIALYTVSKYASSISDGLMDILVDNFTSTVSSFSNSTKALTQEANGSGYDLGELDGSLNGILRKFPAAVNVTLFRPYLWEAGKVITLVASLESVALLLFTVYLLLKFRLSLFYYVFKDLNVIIFIYCTIIFAFVVGITTYNFGTLSRFKIPCIPFFLMSLFALLNYAKLSKPKLVQ